MSVCIMHQERKNINPKWLGVKVALLVIVVFTASVIVTSALL